MIDPIDMAIEQSAKAYKQGVEDGRAEGRKEAFEEVVNRIELVNPDLWNHVCIEPFLLGLIADLKNGGAR